MTDLKEEVPGIVLLVLAIVVIFIPLIVLISKYYLVNQENMNVQKTIDTIMAKIDGLKKGEGNDFTIQGFKGAENWYLVGWDKDEVGRPDKCFVFNGCICLCKLGPSEYFSDNGIDANFRGKFFSPVCQKSGFCREAGIASLSVKTFLLVDGQLTNLNVPYVHLPTNLLSVRIEKSELKDNGGKTISSLSIQRLCDKSMETEGNKCPAVHSSNYQLEGI